MENIWVVMKISWAQMKILGTHIDDGGDIIFQHWNHSALLYVIWSEVLVDLYSPASFA